MQRTKSTIRLPEELHQEVVLFAKESVPETSFQRTLEYLVRLGLDEAKKRRGKSDE